jgi:hypothetical protein
MNNGGREIEYMTDVSNARYEYANHIGLKKVVLAIDERNPNRLVVNMVYADRNGNNLILKPKFLDVALALWALVRAEWKKYGWFGHMLPLKFVIEAVFCCGSVEEIQHLWENKYKKPNRKDIGDEALPGFLDDCLNTCTAKQLYFDFEKVEEVEVA